LACSIAAVIIFISCCCFIKDKSSQHLKWNGREWVAEEEERVEIPDIGGDAGVDRGGLNREPVGDYNSPSREAQYPQEQWDGRAWASSRDAESSRDSESSQQQYNMTRNVIIGELGQSGRQGGEYRGKSTGDHNLPSRDAQYPGKQWDGRSWVESRDPQSSQQQYINTRNVREERFKAPVPSAPAVLELEKPRSSQGGNRGSFTGEPTGGNNDSDLKKNKLRNQERREVKLKAPVPSAPAVLELKEPRSLQGGQTCCVCMTQTIEIIFNCAHAATCEECAKSLCVCPICRADITSRNRIYLIGV